MSSAFQLQPYAAGKKPFSLALEPLDLAHWIEPDGHLLAELALKRQLLAEHFDAVVRAPEATADAQAETLELLVTFLLARHADIYQRCVNEMIIRSGGATVALTSDRLPPLVTAASLVQDDLVLMQRGPDGWRLAAAVLCAPSSWSLVEKFGQTLDDIHGRVPGYAGQMAMRMARIFDNLTPDRPLWRMNWSLYDDAVLFHPEIKSKLKRWSGPGGQFGETAFMRVERQTLRRLPRSGAILFTIRVYVDPVAAVCDHPDGARIAAAIAESVECLDPDQLRYKRPQR